MSQTLEKHNEDLQKELDEAAEKIEELNAYKEEYPAADFEQLQKDLQEKETELEGKDAEVADIKDLAETGKVALKYAREYALGAYVSFAQVSADSEEYAQYQAELREDNDFVGIMRAAAGYYRRSRLNRAKGRESSSEYPPAPNAQEKPKFVGRSAIGAVAS